MLEKYILHLAIWAPLNSFFFLHGSFLANAFEGWIESVCIGPCGLETCIIREMMCPSAGREMS